MKNRTPEKKTVLQSVPDGRTNWAHERTRLAKERTFASWLRTGLSAVAAGVGLVKLFPSVEPQWMMQAMGILFVGSGGMIFVLGYKTYHTVIKKLELEGFNGFPSALMGGLTAILLLGTILGLVLVIIE